MKIKTAELSIAQMKFLWKLQQGETPSRSAGDRVGHSLVRLGLVNFLVMIGWVATAEGLKVDIPDELMGDA